MYIYSVTINIEKSAEQEWLDFMQKKHIADVLNTGYFTGASMRKEINNNDELYSLYNIEYMLESEDNYHAYQQKNAAELQKDVTDRFNGKFSAVRKFYNVLSEQ
ncbi:MAG: DUF4286 family protein [Chitinophagales bacterium]